MPRAGPLAVSIIAGLALGVGSAILVREVGGESHRYLPPTLEDDTRRLGTEYPLAASRRPYLILDLTARRIDSRISGLTVKSIPVEIQAVRGAWAGVAPSPSRMALLTLKDRGAPAEVIRPPDPTAPEDPLQDPKIFPPDPPTDYTLSFEEPVKVRIQGVDGPGVGSALRRAGSAIRTWLGDEMGGEKGATTIRLGVPRERAQEIYRALFEGEKVLVLGGGPGPGKAPGKTKVSGR